MLPFRPLAPQTTVRTAVWPITSFGVWANFAQFIPRFEAFHLIPLPLTPANKHLPWCKVIFSVPHALLSSLAPPGELQKPCLPLRPPAPSSGIPNFSCAETISDKLPPPQKPRQKHKKVASRLLPRLPRAYQGFRALQDPPSPKLGPRPTMRWAKWAVELED